MSIDCNSTIPVQGNECPRQGCRNHWDVDETRVSVVTEIERGQVEEFDDQDDFSPDEVAADE